MRNKRRFRSGPLLLLLSSLGPAPGCGTEIGNGRKPPETMAPDGETKAPEHEVFAPSSEVPASPLTPLARLFIACASPIVEMATSAFDATLAAEDFTVVETGGEAWNIISNGSTLSVEADPTAALPFQIKSQTVVLSALGCSRVTSESSAGVTLRTALYTDGSKTIWSLDANLQVATIKMLDADASVLAQWQKP